ILPPGVTNRAGSIFARVNLLPGLAFLPSWGAAAGPHCIVPHSVAPSEPPECSVNSTSVPNSAAVNRSSTRSKYPMSSQPGTESKVMLQGETPCPVLVVPTQRKFSLLGSINTPKGRSVPPQVPQALKVAFALSVLALGQVMSARAGADTRKGPVVR